MRLGPDMNHLNTFHLHRNKGGSKWAGGGRIQKKIKKYNEFNKISTLTSRNNSLQNALKVGIFLLLSLTEGGGRGVG